MAVALLLSAVFWVIMFGAGGKARLSPTTSAVLATVLAIGLFVFMLSGVQLGKPGH